MYFFQLYLEQGKDLSNMSFINKLHLITAQQKTLIWLIFFSFHHPAQRVNVMVLTA